jgi:alpha-L-fucosidase
MKKTGILSLIFILYFFSASSQEYTNSWESIDSRPIPEWFQDAKFGIFIHWGVYSVPAWRKVESGRYASYAEWYYARVMDNKKNGGYQFHRENYGTDFEYRDFGHHQVLKGEHAIAREDDFVKIRSQVEQIWHEAFS